MTDRSPWSGTVEADIQSDTSLVYLPQKNTVSETSSAPILLLMAGFAGAGKTTLAQNLHKEFGWEVINKDELKLAQLANGNWDEMDEAARRIFIEQAGRNAFNTLLDQTHRALLDRKSVIVDTSNEKPTIFKNITELLTLLQKDAYPIQPLLLVILCMARKEIRTERLEKRGSVFQPYVHELPTILDDSALPVRFQHLFQRRSVLSVVNSMTQITPLEKWKTVFEPSVDDLFPLLDHTLVAEQSPSLGDEDHVFIVNTDQALNDYIGEITEAIKALLIERRLARNVPNHIE